MSDPTEGSAAWVAQDKGPSILAVCWTMTAISTAFVIARLSVRGLILRQLRSDDYFTVLALVCGYISVALSTVAVSYGNGRHFSLLTTEQQEGAILFTIAGFCPGVMSFGLPKMAVVSLLTKLLNPSRPHFYFLWFLGIWCQLTLFATVGVLIGQCYPARALWDFDIEGECFDKQILVDYCIYAGSFSAFVDLYLAVYPTIVLFKLQMNMKKKLALCCALGIGSVSMIVAIYKTTRIPSLASSDFSYDTSDLVIWTVTEGSTIIIASSIPILQPLVEIIYGHNPFGSSRDKRSPRYYEDYSKDTNQYELSVHKQRSRIRPDPDETIMKDDSSQEEILTPTTHKQRNNASTGISDGLPIAPGITRTDEFTISFTPDEDKFKTVTEKWKPV